MLGRAVLRLALKLKITFKQTTIFLQNNADLCSLILYKLTVLRDFCFVEAPRQDLAYSRLILIQH